ncbi:DNA-binding protein [Rhodanobacter thiooxydans]|uniref:DNA-binding protein n=1 Tax=Rhodanobacter thiooxydans TaxID=416169 RepID=A0A154QLI4_9GAMM|nr:WYL domain-containing protein [Rhodanobacter thiooxydans]EIL96700.1 helix-turn-helix, type 11 domain-containing protein [Rhodanobacter thiooxydans LCS2]KZC25157.1 DNA-binding protein [Rhodanobacter thiooxydans]MCW0203541.1 WYL domain-containing protein [Rhodanobacter thiooxydans]
MSKSDHEKLASRLASVLLKLNQGESFSPQDLADEFRVDERTIYRDLNRLKGIAERSLDGKYRLVPEYQGKLHPKDLETFAKLVGVEDLFPQNSSRFLMALLDTLSQSSFLVRGHRYEKLKPHDAQFQQLDKAIRGRKRCTLTYADKRRSLEPYRLVNNKGIWYLAATDDGRLKSFSLSRISQLMVGSDGFEPRVDIQRQIEEEDDVWFGEEKTEVLLSVAPQVAYYFKRRKLLPLQVIDKELENGGLIVSSRVSNENQILSLVRYWIPHVRILEPGWLRESLEAGVKLYLG